MSILPVALNDLIYARTVESVRIEFKSSWGEMIRDKTIQTVCAFANDFQGLNGGYIVLGVDDKEGQPVLPPGGLDDFDIEKVQNEIRGNCNRIEPPYQPILSPELFMGKRILVVYAPMGDARPYQAPEHCHAGPLSRHYYIRLGPSTVKAEGDLRTQLLQLSSRVPFDERRRSEVPLSAISGSLVAKYLSDVGSDLIGLGSNPETRDILQRLRLSAGTNGSEAPRNAALLFFTDNPEDYFSGARVEVAQFRDDAGGDLIETHTFRGPLPQQIVSTLDFLERLFGEFTKKVPGDAQAERFVPYPHEALREAIANAVFHRSYDGQPIPTKIGLYPDRIEITSYPGPVPGVELNQLQPGARPPQTPARNPRIGELLKALRLAETWHTGVPKIFRKMRENGSPEARFDFDATRTYFRVTLPAHPGYVVLHAMREAAGFWHTGERSRALSHLREARERAPRSGALAAQLIEYLSATGDLSAAKRVLGEISEAQGVLDKHLATVALARAYLDVNQRQDAVALLATVAIPTGAQAAVDLAILHKRSDKFAEAHRVFASASELIQNDPKALHEFAQTKLKLAEAIRPRQHTDRVARHQLYREASELLQRVVQLAHDSPARSAWAWYDLAKTRAWLKEPESTIIDAIDRAIQLETAEKRFLEWKLNHVARRSPAGMPPSKPSKP